MRKQNHLRDWPDLFVTRTTNLTSSIPLCYLSFLRSKTLGLSKVSIISIASSMYTYMKSLSEKDWKEKYQYFFFKSKLSNVREKWPYLAWIGHVPDMLRAYTGNTWVNIFMIFQKYFSYFHAKGSGIIPHRKLRFHFLLYKIYR